MIKSVDVLPCGHVALVGPRRLCRHLIGSDVEMDYVRLFTGAGTEYDLCCPVCERDRSELVVACEGCVARVDDDELGCLGYRGSPEVRERPEPIAGRFRRVRLPLAPRAVAPVEAASQEWLLLDADADAVVRWDGVRGEVLSRVPIEVPQTVGTGYFESMPPKPRLHASRSGRFCAVVNDFDRHGTVVDLHTGRRTALLDRGEYYPGTTRFPFAFITHPDGDRFVHATAWNRLDISDAATGRVLTERPFPFTEGKRPEHYLDYFHGALCVSPDGRWIADDGWAWQPVGMPVVWDMRAWWHNPYETEDGPSRTALAYRPKWNYPMCWLGNRLVVGGLGAWGDYALLPGVRLFDPNAGQEVDAFVGPSGEMFAVGERLVAAAPDGAEIWDPGTGERLGRLPGFTPIAHHPGSDELLAVEDDAIILWTSWMQRDES